MGVVGSDRDQKFNLRRMEQDEFQWIRIAGENSGRQGPWKFVSQGTIGAYPHFVNEHGMVVPWHAVDQAQR